MIRQTFITFLSISFLLVSINVNAANILFLKDGINQELNLPDDNNNYWMVDENELLAMDEDAFLLYDIIYIGEHVENFNSLRDKRVTINRAIAQGTNLHIINDSNIAFSWVPGIVVTTKSTFQFHIDIPINAAWHPLVANYNILPRDLNNIKPFNNTLFLKYSSYYTPIARSNSNLSAILAGKFGKGRILLQTL